MSHHRCLLQRRVALQNRYTNLITRRRQHIWWQLGYPERSNPAHALFSVQGTLIVRQPPLAATATTQHIPIHMTLTAASPEQAVLLCQQEVLMGAGFDQACIAWWETLEVAQVDEPTPAYA